MESREELGALMERGAREYKAAQKPAPLWERAPEAGAAPRALRGQLRDWLAEWRERLGLTDRPIHFEDDQFCGVRVGPVRAEMGPETGILRLWIEKEESEGHRRPWDRLHPEAAVVLGLLNGWCRIVGVDPESQGLRESFALVRLAQALVRLRRSEERVARGPVAAQALFEQEHSRALCLAGWQERLLLSDWRIVLRWARHWEVGEDADGRLRRLPESRRAAIWIKRNIDEPPDELPHFDYDPELVLVHELVHVWLAEMGIPPDDPREEREEQMVEAIAQAFIDMHRGMA